MNVDFAKIHVNRIVYPETELAMRMRRRASWPVF